jgi:hypothetical protein
VQTGIGIGMPFEMRARHPLAHLVHTQGPPDVAFGAPVCGAMGTYCDQTKPVRLWTGPGAWTDCDVQCARTQGHDGPHMTAPRKMPRPAWRRWATYEWTNPENTA